MKNRLLSASAMVSILFAACSQSPVSLPSDEEIVSEKARASIHPTEMYVLGQVQVDLAKESQIDAVIDNLSAQGIQASVLDKVPNRAKYLLKIQSTQSVPEVVKALKKDDRVVGAMRNNITTLEALRVNDPLLRTQWAVKNIGQEAPRSLSGKKGADIGMDGVTAEGSYDVVVGVIDTGIDYFHEDLAITDTVDGKKRVLPGSNIWVNTEEVPDNGINDDNNGDPQSGIKYVDDVHGYNFVSKTGDPMDDQGHGTHVSGVIGALRNNFKGIVGINQKVSLMGLKFLSAEGSGSDFDARLAIYYAIDMKKRHPEKKFILTNSWGSAGRNSKNGDEDDLLLADFAAASNEDILIVAAAGNDGTSNRFFEHYPSNYAGKITNFISVAATNNLDQLASFSSYGYGLVQMAAPGVLIQSTVPAEIYPSGYEAWSGTSMATPHVTGAAALVWGENPALTATQVKERLLATVDILPQLHGVVNTSGRLNVKRALANDSNIGLDAAIVEEMIPYVQESRRTDTPASFDLLDTIEAEGAKELSVCFSRINLAQDFDWIEILDASYRVKDTISGEYRDTNFKKESREICSAPVAGSKLYIRLAAEAGPSSLKGYLTKYLKVVK